MNDSNKSNDAANISDVPDSDNDQDDPKTPNCVLQIADDDNLSDGKEHKVIIEWIHYNMLRIM